MSAQTYLSRTTRSRSKAIRESQLDKAGNAVEIKSLIAERVLSMHLPGVIVPVRSGAARLGQPAAQLLSAIYFRACLYDHWYTEVVYAAFFAPFSPRRRWRNPLITP